MSDTEGCSLDSLPSTSSSLVLPGGDTRCIFSYSTPFAFQVYRGDSDKLLFYFQGGGESVFCRMYMSVYLSVYLFVYLFTFPTTFLSVSLLNA